jgi:hypothetical protein
MEIAAKGTKDKIMAIYIYIYIYINGGSENIYLKVRKRNVHQLL